jgi:hypothetical protein
VAGKQAKILSRGDVNDLGRQGLSRRERRKARDRCSLQETASQKTDPLDVAHVDSSGWRLNARHMSQVHRARASKGRLISAAGALHALLDELEQPLETDSRARYWQKKLEWIA